MSRRPPPNPAAERAAQNQQTIKSLLKLEANKLCADCKKNKHPRWASWNLGIFICIRCSGIHRGMGTHISRVKSVDLDAWTDEQLKSVLSWGNGRANKYWEAKLAAGHVPSEAKIENFIRTKYELKRWVMDGPIPDPASLDVDGDDDIPLSIVKEKQSIERKESIRKASVGKSSAPSRVPAPTGDLMGEDPIPQRASTAGPTATQVPPKATAAPPKATSNKDSLLGLDFLGTEVGAPPRPASTTGTPGQASGQSRPDLKQSILSLYATAPRPQPPPQAQPQQVQQSAFGSPPQAAQAGGNGLNDAFSSLSFSTVQAQKSPQNDAFAGLGNFGSSRPAPQTNSSAFSGLSGGSFFDTKLTPAAPVLQQQSAFGGLGGFGGLGSPTTTAPAPKPAAVPASSGFGDLFDLSTPAQPAAPQPSRSPAAAAPSSVFNLSSTQAKPTSPAITPAAAPVAVNNNWSGADVWGNNAWSTPEPAAKPAAPSTAASPPVASNSFGWGTGSGSLASQSIVPGPSGGFSTTAPKVAADEEFGGWTTSTTAPTATSKAKPAGALGNNEDLFSNVWS